MALGFGLGGATELPVPWLPLRVQPRAPCPGPQSTHLRGFPRTGRTGPRTAPPRSELGRGVTGRTNAPFPDGTDNSRARPVPPWA